MSQPAPTSSPSIKREIQPSPINFFHDSVSRFTQQRQITRDKLKSPVIREEFLGDFIWNEAGRSLFLVENDAQNQVPERFLNRWSASLKALSPLDENHLATTWRYIFEAAQKEGRAFNVSEIDREKLLRNDATSIEIRHKVHRELLTFLASHGYHEKPGLPVGEGEGALFGMGSIDFEAYRQLLQHESDLPAVRELGSGGAGETLL